METICTVETEGDMEYGHLLRDWYRQLRTMTGLRIHIKNTKQFSLSYILEKRSSFLPLKKKIARYVLVQTDWFACLAQKRSLSKRRKNRKDGFPVVWSIYLTDSPKTWQHADFVLASASVSLWRRFTLLHITVAAVDVVNGLRQGGKKRCSNWSQLWWYPHETELQDRTFSRTEGTCFLCFT